ncbi:MAG: dihydrofolate reductase, partial [Bacteroidales bacterium]|nr:dihydrofolate reductase [Bacteroidales bacterium]
MINLIAAISDNNAIGVANSMPWHISSDLKFFKARTMGSTVIMGRRTWESIGCKALPGRLNIVITSSKEPFETAEKADSFENAIALAKKLTPESEIFIIGGGSLYRQAIGVADRLYI